MTERIRWSLMKQRLRRLVRDSDPYAAMCGHHRDVMRSLADRGRHPHIRDDDALTHLAADLARNCRECCGHTAAGDYEIGRTR